MEEIIFRYGCNIFYEEIILYNIYKIHIDDYSIDFIDENNFLIAHIEDYKSVKELLIIKYVTDEKLNESSVLFIKNGELKKTNLI